MAVKIEQWNADKAKTELAKRLRVAKEYRRRFEEQWQTNERMLYDNSAMPGSNASMSFTSLAEIAVDTDGPVSSMMGINYAFRYLRFIHSQMSANPPSVIPSPTSPDIADRKKADAADRCVRYLRVQHDLQEVTDIWSLNTLTYGTGWIKPSYDSLAGDLDDEKDNEVVMEGDNDVSCPSTWNMWIDPDAKTWSKCRYTFEKLIMPLEEATFRFPKKAALLEELKGKMDKDSRFWSTDKDERKPSEQDTVELYEYHERGLPWNGMAGRHGYCLEDGELLDDLEANDTPGALLPYVMLTDIDVPDRLYGKTFVDYILPLQDTLNRLDSAVLDSVQAHGVVRMVLPDDCEIEDESISDSSWDVIKVKSSNPGFEPHFAPVPSLMPDLYKLRQQIVDGMEALAGMNESMFGQIKRELSGFATQTAINAGNMTRRRLFNKYTLGVKNLYMLMLAWVKQEWKQKRLVKTLGKELAFEAVEIAGADILDGYDLVVEYGTSLSLDPASRREEIMQLLPLFDKADITPRQQLSMLKLNELGDLYDLSKLGELRQQEIFDEMISKYQAGVGVAGIYIAPEKNEDHKHMMEAAEAFRMSAAFKYLDKPLRDLIDQHIDARVQMAASIATTGGAPGAASGLPSPAGSPTQLGPKPAPSPLGAAMAGTPAAPQPPMPQAVG